MRFLFALARLLLLALVIRYLVVLIYSLFRGRSEIRNPDPQPRALETRRDPVCGTFVASDIAIKGLFGGQEQYFCSTACRERFAMKHNS